LFLQKRLSSVVDFKIVNALSAFGVELSYHITVAQQEAKQEYLGWD
jgi:hypothetical protein